MDQLPHFRKEDYFNMGRWVQPTLPGVFWCYWNDAESVKAAGHGQTFDHIVIVDGNFPVKTSDKGKMRRMIEELWRDPVKLEQYTDLLDGVGNRSANEHLALIGRTDMPLTTYIPELFRTYLEVVGFWTLMLMGDVLNDMILEQKMATTHEEMVEHLAPVARVTWLEEQARDLRAIARAIQKMLPEVQPSALTSERLHDVPEIASAITAHVENYRWFGTHHWMGKGYDVAKCVAEIRDVLEKGIPEDRRELKKASASLHPVWKLLAAVSYWRTHCAEVTSKVIFASRPQLTACASSWNLSYSEFIYLTHNEILRRLADPRYALPSVEQLKEREKTYGGYVDEAGNEHVVTGPEVQTMLHLFISTEKVDAREFKGVVASKGPLVRGTAKVIIDPRDFKKFSKGDILVAPETTPDYVPTMKLAAAIVTDRGGITSHASIVSRELGVPCIIGTNIGTQALSDGDEVEVDAEQGVVRILQRRA